MFRNCSQLLIIYIITKVKNIHLHRCNCPSSALPFSSNSWIAEAGPKSGLFHAFNAQTTFLSGVISNTCTELPQSFGSFIPLGHQLQITVLPFSSRLHS